MKSKFIKESGYLPVTGPSKINYGGPVENSGLVYKVMPLSFNLLQKGNDNQIKRTSKCNYKIGDLVSGVCLYDKKEHYGYISNIMLDKHNNVQIIYIIDYKTKLIVALKPKTTYYIHQSQIDLLNDVNESYLNSTEQMNSVIKLSNKEFKNYLKHNDVRQLLLINILGKTTYNKYVNKGVFAPVPLSALHLSITDFAKLDITWDDEEVMNPVLTLVNMLAKIYYRNEFKVVYYGEYSNAIKTNIVFSTVDDIIDFFINIQKCFKKIYKRDNINWKPLIKKFKNYLR